jgi:2-phosphosulfolactate phosphatase
VTSLHVLYTPAQWEQPPDGLLSEACCVVIDVLRATSTIVTGLAQGAEAFLPVGTLEEAQAQHVRNPQAKLAGERHGLKPSGFDFGNSPREMTAATVSGQTLIHTTTNGTRALQACAGASEIIVAALLNFQAVLDHVRQHPALVVLVCAGTGQDFALEDAFLAGALAHALEPTHPAGALYRAWSHQTEQVLLRSVNGRRLQQLGLTEDVRWCAQWNRFAMVPMLNCQGLIRPM